MTMIPLAPHIGVEQIGLIEGQQPDSVEEWRVAVGLWSYDWDFRYRVQVRGGRARLGGGEIDFLVETRPLLTGVFVDGEHWHRGQKKALDLIVRLNLKSAMRAEYGHEPRFVELAASDLYSQEAASQKIRFEIGRN